MAYTHHTDVRISAVAPSLQSGTVGDPFKIFLRGRIVFDQILDVSAFDYLEVDAGEARITSTMAPVVGDADKWTNTLVKSAASVITYNPVSTVTTNIAEPGETILEVASTIYMAAGDWLQVYSYNVDSRPANYITSMEDVPVFRYYKIKTVDSAIQVTIYGMIRYWQAVGSTVKKVRVPIGVTWNGGEFDCSGGTIANAFWLDGVQDIQMESIKLTGFSRAGIELSSGCRGATLDRIKHGGGINCAIMLKGPEDVVVTRFSSPFFAAATKHPNGVPRALINCRSRAQNIVVSGAHFAWASMGIRLWAPEGFQGDALVFSDLDGRNIVGEGRGVCIDGGQAGLSPDLANEVDGAAFGNGVKLSNISITNCFGSSTQCLIYYHDWVGPTMHDVTVRHHGRGDGGTPGGATIPPIIISDCPGGQIHGVYCTGTYGVIATENGAANNGIISNIYLEAACGSLYSQRAMFHFNHGAAGPMTIRDVKISNGGILWEFGTQFNDPYTAIENFQGDTWTQPASRLVCVVNNGARPANVGQIYMLTGALGGTSNLYPIMGAPTAGAVQKCVATASGAGLIFETGTNGGYGYVQELGPGMKSYVRVANNVGTGPVLLQGDLVRHCAAGDGAVGNARGDNAATINTALGAVIGAIAAPGAVALTRLR